MTVVRLLFHSDDATYDAQTKTYYFNLDRKIHFPNKLRFVKCQYANKTTEVHPLVVFVRSHELSKLIKAKHTIRCKDTNHEQYEPIMCTLEETHKIGRFFLNPETEHRTFALDQSRFVQRIDFQFTDNATPLAKTATSTAVASTAEDVLAFGDSLVSFIDFGTGRVQDQAFQNLSTPGDRVYYLRNRGPNTELLFVSSYQAGGQLANFGDDGALSITQHGSWESYLDSWPLDQGDVADEFCVHTLVKFTSLSFTYVLDIGFLKILVDSQQISYVDANDAKQGVFQFTPMVPYMLTVRRVANGQSFNFEWVLEDLTDNTAITATTGSGLSAWPNANGFPFRLGHASTHFSHLQSAMIIHNTLNTEWQATSQTYLRNYYNGTTSNSSENETTTTDAQWFIEVELDQGRTKSR